MKTVGITMDIEGPPVKDLTLHVPAPRDTLVSVLKDGTYGATYEIVAVREVQRRDPAACPRFVLRCRRVPYPGRQALWRFTWYSRRRRSHPG